MKKNLGNIVLLLLIFINLDASQEYIWSASINKKEVYLNEAVHLHYSCQFNSKDELHVIEFDPVGKYKDYDIYLLSERESIINGKRVNDFEFIAFLKTSGHVDFEFDVLMKKTNQDSIENTVLGRDNAGYEQFSKRLIKQKKLSVEVLPNDIALVGGFNFKIKKDKPSIDAYKPYHFEITIEGIGNLDQLKPLDLNISGAKVFSTEPKKNYEINDGGFKGSWSQKFAVVSSESFKFPQIKYEYFDANLKQVKVYKSKPFEVEVRKLYKKEDLLDKKEEKSSFFKIEYLYYLLVFIFGFLVGKIKFKKTVPEKSDEIFKSKIDKCKNLDELLTILVINNSKKYAYIIEKIESKQIGLKEAKKIVFLER